ncbi:GTPase Era [Thalassotalea atypica]|uniref:GTPase Era n=1 Tax=Thalassotalea atypica TaxID=2054316 RepID=UPI0025742B2E|nr:GTPase Era [Thalassotalea atypica]
MTNNTTFCGLIAIVGRPNVGKSTLLNALLGQKVSITSRKPQTTRHRILGILTEKDKQAVLVDTPGLHSDEKRAINRLMNRAASSSISEVESIVFLVEGTHWTKDDELVLNKVKQSGAPCILAINKIDNVQDKEALLPHLEKLGKLHNFSDIIPISASKGDNVDKIKAMCLSSLPESDFWFPEDYITDRSSRFMASEILREKLMRFTGDELPYSTTVEIEQFKQDAKGILHINALILIERNSQKRMVIGNKGERLKTIGQEARRDMEDLFDQQVFLETFVKVKSGWADDERALRSLGYGDDYSG